MARLQHPTRSQAPPQLNLTITWLSPTIPCLVV